MPVLEVVGLTKRFGSLTALRGVTFAVEAGDIFGYLGPNGAGKTTTLRIIVDLVRADAGSVRLFGSGEPASARARERIGYLPGELHPYEDLTARGLLDYFARFRPHRPAFLRKRLLEVLAIDGHTLDRRVRHLSHGTRQKIGLVTALQHDPDLWLLDEPTLGLDPLVQQDFRYVVREAAARGRAVLLSSHVLSEVEAVASRVGIISAGEILTVQSVAALRERAVRHLAVRFRGEAPSDLGTVAGVERVVVDGSEAWLDIRGDVNPVVRRLATEEIDRLAFPEPELEDIFLGYYRE